MQVGEDVPDMSNAAYHRAYYARNAAKIRAARSCHEKARRAYHRAIVLEHKQCGCRDCGELDPIVLDFDHVRGKKVANIAEMCGKVSEKTMLAEIAKCDVRCANCHRRKTYAPEV